MLGLLHLHWARVDPQNPDWSTMLRISISSFAATVPIVVLSVDWAQGLVNWLASLLAVDQAGFAGATLAFSLGMFVAPALNPPLKLHAGEYTSKLEKLVIEKKHRIGGTILKTTALAAGVGALSFVGLAYAELIAAGCFGLLLSRSKLQVACSGIPYDFPSKKWDQSANRYSRAFVYSSAAFTGILFCFGLLGAGSGNGQASLVGLVMGAIVAALLD